MKKNIYEVIFLDGGSMEVWAFSAEQARILAQAERIQRGQDYAVAECLYLGELK